MNLADIVCIETPGAEGEPIEWPANVAALVSLRSFLDRVPLNDEQWAKLSDILRIARRVTPEPDSAERTEAQCIGCGKLRMCLRSESLTWVCKECA